MKSIKYSIRTGQLKLINSLCLVLLAFLFVGCDSFLDIRPKGSLIPENAEDYEKLLNYSQLVKSSDTFSLYMTDDVYIPNSVSNNPYLGVDQMETYAKNLYTFQEEVFSESETDPLWEYSYNRIFYYNVIVSEIMDSKGASKEEKLAIKAEALVGRAFEYLTLVNVYGKQYDPKTASTDLAVPLIVDEDLSAESLKRATVQEVYDFIEDNLAEAAPNLPVKPKNNAYRASKAVGFGMLARMYLYMGDYKKALENANISLQTNDVLLDYKKYGLVEGRYYIGRINLPASTENPENIYIRLAPWVFSPSMMAYLSDEMLNLFDKEKDKRFLLFATHEPIPGQNLPENYYLWMPYIYSNLAMATPEMYLIAAECEARIGSKDRAMELINKLRDNRIIDNTPLTASSNEDALKKVLDERRRELTMNGFTRFIDLKRLNKEPALQKTVVHVVNDEKFVLEPNSPKYVFPIPREVMKFNPNMVQNKR